MRTYFFMFTFLCCLAPDMLFAAPSPSAVLRLFCNQDQAYIFINDESYGQFPKGSNKSIELPAGTHVVRVAKHGFKEHRQTVTLKVGDAYNVAAALRPDPATLYDAGLTIESDPTGALVYLGGDALGSTPLAITNIPPGRFVFALEKEFYHRKVVRVAVSKTSHQQLRETLLESFGFLSVSSLPEAAKALINGKLIGRTPLRDHKLTSGTYELTLQLDLHRTLQKKVTVSDGQTTYVNFALEDFAGDLEVSTEPVTSSVFIAGEFRGKTPLKTRLSPGDYALQLIPDNSAYKVEQQRIAIVQNKKVSISKQLEVGFGTLDVKSSPEGANIYLSSTFYGLNKKAYGRASRVIENLPAGMYRLELEFDGYRTESLDVVIGDQETTEISKEMVRDRTLFKYLLYGSSALLFVSGLYGSTHFYASYKTARVEEDELYQKYGQVFRAALIEKRWKEYEKAKDKRVSAQAFALGSMALVGIAAGTFAYAFALPEYEQVAGVIDIGPEGVALCLEW